LALAVATLPTAIWIFIGFWMAIVIDKKVSVQDKIKYSFLNGGIMVLFYASPIIYIFISHSPKMSNGLLHHIVRLSFFRYQLIHLFDPLKPYQAMMVILFAIIGLARFKHRNPIIFTLFILLVGSFFINIGYLKNFSFLIPIFYLMAALGFWHLLSGWKVRDIYKHAVYALVVLLYLSQAFPSFQRDIWMPKTDFAKTMSQYLDEYFATSDHFHILIHSTQVEYFSAPKLRNEFEETKNVPLAPGLVRLRSFLKSHSFLRALLDYIPELRNRGKKDRPEIDYASQYYVVMPRVVTKRHNKIPDVFTRYGYDSKKILISKIDVQYMNDEYLLLKAHLAPLQ
jgi:hypothetical protein